MATLSREHFVFSIGFVGGDVIVNRKLMKKYGKLSVSQLLQKGLYRAAFCRALFDNDEAEIKEICTQYATIFAIPVHNAKDLSRLFGVDHVPSGEEVQKIVLV